MAILHLCEGRALLAGAREGTETYPLTLARVGLRDAGQREKAMERAARKWQETQGEEESQMSCIWWT